MKVISKSSTSIKKGTLRKLQLAIAQLRKQLDSSEAQAINKIQNNKNQNNTNKPENILEGTPSKKLRRCSTCHTMQNYGHKCEIKCASLDECPTNFKGGHQGEKRKAQQQEREEKKQKKVDASEKKKKQSSEIRSLLKVPVVSAWKDLYDEIKRRKVEELHRDWESFTTLERKSVWRETSLKYTELTKVANKKKQQLKESQTTTQKPETRRED